MKHTTISDVFFDLDHTLWDFEKNSALTFATILQKHAVEVNLEDFLRHYVPINILYWEKYRKEEIDQNELRYGRLKATFDLLAHSISDEKIDLLAHEYIHYLPQYNHLFDGALEILNYLQPKYTLHIITNGFQDVQNKKLVNSNILHYFTTITNSEMAGVKKPNPLIFEFALELAKAQKETSIMIGDSFVADVDGALNCGLDAILFSENRIEIPSAIKQIHRLSEIKKYL